MFNIVNSDINITSDELIAASHKYDKTLRTFAVYALAQILQHMTVVEGVRGSLTWGQLKAKASWALYKKNSQLNSNAEIAGRTLTTRLLSLIDQFDPNEVAGTIYHEGPNSGDTLKNLPITVQVMARKLKEASEEIYFAMFKGELDESSGTTPMTSMDGFDTICAKEAAADTPGISAAKKNLIDLSSYDDLDVTNTFAAINYIWLCIDQKMKDFGTQAQPVRFYVDPLICEYYNRGYKDEMGAVVYNTKWNQTQVLGSEGRAILLPLAAKKDSNWIQVTHPANMLFGCGTKAQMDNLTVDRIPPFDVMMSGTMWAGVQFKFLDPSIFTAVKLHGVKAPSIEDLLPTSSTAAADTQEPETNNETPSGSETPAGGETPSNP